MDTADAKLLNMAELSVVLRVTPRTIRGWITKGTMKGVYKFGPGNRAEYRFDLAAVLEGMRVKGSTGGPMDGL